MNFPSKVLRPEYIIIAGIARNGVIGKGMALPWKVPGDMKLFRELTMGHPVVMGRKTWESMGQIPLPGRQNIIISRSLRATENAWVLPDLGKLSEVLPADTERVFFIGGAVLYAEALKIVHTLYLSEMHFDAEGDTTFPAWDRTQWRLEEKRAYDRFDFCIYRRK